MGLEFADVKSKPLRPKGTVHKSGKLGFNSDAAQMMDLSGDEVFCVAYDDEEGPDGDLYLLSENPKAPERSCIEVARAGDYYHLNLRRFFERYDIDYERYKIIYDVVDSDTSGVEYRLDRREDVKERT